MFEKNMRLAYLLDFYGDALDEHTRSMLKAYYEDDLSLSEIADGESISRQGVRHVIKKGEEQLEFLESKLGLAKKNSILLGISSELEKVKARLSAISEAEFSEEIRTLDSAINAIFNRGV